MLLIFLRVITVLTCALCVLYTVLIGRYCYGWIKTKVVLKNNSDTAISVAVIIAARNEETIISQCLDAVTKQNYPATHFEIVVVDDHSEDATAAVVQRYCDVHSNVKIISLKDKKLSGKKNAIAAAIAETPAELIVTTDADCVMTEHWLRSIVDFYAVTNSKMIVAPVAFNNGISIFEKMQSLEFIALMGSTAGSLYFNKAILCNGANLAYTKKVFGEVNGFSGIDGGASGDDVLLMYKIAEKYKGEIRFLKHRDAIVYTEAKKGLAEFIAQRKRWASKGFGALNAETKYASLLVFSFSFMTLLMGVFTGFAALKTRVCLPFFEICLILTGIKCIIDFLLLFLSASFFKRKHELFLFLPEQFIYMLYVVVVGMPGSRKKLEWKGRKL